MSVYLNAIETIESSFRVGNCYWTAAKDTYSLFVEDFLVFNGEY